MAARGGRGQTHRAASSQHGSGSQGAAKRTAKWSNVTASIAAPPTTEHSNGTAGSAMDESRARQMHDRMVFLLMCLVGCRVTVTLREGGRFEGILSTATAEGEVNVSLKYAHNVDEADATPKPQLLILAKDLVDVQAADVDLERRAAAAANTTSTASDSFRTDTDISAAPTAGDGRTLQKWDAPTSEPLTGLEDASGTSQKGWDQFAVNERMFGTKTNYREEIYTTKLDRTGAGYKDKERKADRLAAEILSGTSANSHILEERNATASGKEVDEEDRYGAVIRGPAAYVPPAARSTANVAVAAAAVAAARKANGDLGPSEQPSLRAGTSATLPHKSTSLNVAATNGPAGATPSATSPVRQLSQILGSAGTTQAGTPSESSNSLNQLVPDLKNFVQTEKERIAAKRQAQVKKEKDSKLADLLKFSQSFKYNVPIPDDLVPILAKNPDKQRQIQEKAHHEAEHATSALRPHATALAGTARNIAPAEAKASARGVSGGSDRRSPEPTPSNASVKAPRFGEKAATITRESIAQIPPFNALKARGASPAIETAPIAPRLAMASSSSPAPGPSQASASAANNAAKLNPNVSAFVPGVASAASSAPSRKSTAELPPAGSPANPFFGNRPIKKGSSSMHVKEDFTPFKINASTPVPSSVPDTWGFQGKSTKDLAAAATIGNPSVGSRDDDGQSAPATPGTVQHALPPLPGQGVPPSPYAVYHGYAPTQFIYPGAQPYSAAHGTPYATPYGGPAGYAPMGMSHQAFSQAPPQGIPSMYRGNQAMPPMFPSGQPMYFTPASGHGTAPSAHPQPVPSFRRLSSTSSGVGGGPPPPSPYNAMFATPMQGMPTPQPPAAQRPPPAPASQPPIQS